LKISADLRNKWQLVIDRLTVLFLKFLEYFHKMQVFVWWLLELHIIKIVSSYIIWVTVKEASKYPLSKSYLWWRLVNICCMVTYPHTERDHVRDLTEAEAFNWAYQLLGTCLGLASCSSSLTAQIYSVLPYFPGY